MSDGGANRPTLAVEEGFELYRDVLDGMAKLRRRGERSPFDDDGFRPGPEIFADIVWRPKSEERQHFGERIEATEDLAVPRCAVGAGAVELTLRHGAGAVGKRLAVIVNGRLSSLVRPEPPDAGAAIREVRLSLPLDGDVAGKVVVEIVQEQRLVFSRAYGAADGSALEGAQPTPRIVEFRRFDGSSLHLGIKRMEGTAPAPVLKLRVSVDGEERWTTAELDPGAAGAASIQSLYRLPLAGLITPGRVHDIVLLGEGLADRVRKGVFSIASTGDDHFWLSRPAATPEGATVTIVRDAAARGAVSAALADAAGREVAGRPTADPADFRFRKGDNSFAFALEAPFETYRTLHLRDQNGDRLVDVAL